MGSTSRSRRRMRGERFEPEPDIERARAVYLGLFAHLLHIPPPVVDDLLVGDFYNLTAWIEQHQAALNSEVAGG